MTVDKAIVNFIGSGVCALVPGFSANAPGSSAQASGSSAQASGSSERASTGGSPPSAAAEGSARQHPPGKGVTGAPGNCGYELLTFLSSESGAAVKALVDHLSSGIWSDLKATGIPESTAQFYLDSLAELLFVAAPSAKRFATALAMVESATASATMPVVRKKEASGFGANGLGGAILSPRASDDAIARPARALAAETIMRAREGKSLDSAALREDICYDLVRRLYEALLRHREAVAGWAPLVDEFLAGEASENTSDAADAADPSSQSHGVNCAEAPQLEKAAQSEKTPLSAKAAQSNLSLSGAASSVAAAAATTSVAQDAQVLSMERDLLNDLLNDLHGDLPDESLAPAASPIPSPALGQAAPPIEPLASADPAEAAGDEELVAAVAGLEAHWDAEAAGAVQQRIAALLILAAKNGDHPRSARLQLLLGRIAFQLASAPLEASVQGRRLAQGEAEQALSTARHQLEVGLRYFASSDPGGLHPAERAKAQLALGRCYAAQALRAADDAMAVKALAALEILSNAYRNEASSGSTGAAQQEGGVPSLGHAIWFAASYEMGKLQLARYHWKGNREESNRDTPDNSDCLTEALGTFAQILDHTKKACAPAAWAQVTNSMADAYELRALALGDLEQLNLAGEMKLAALDIFETIGEDARAKLVRKELQRLREHLRRFGDEAMMRGDAEDHLHRASLAEMQLADAS